MEGHLNLFLHLKTQDTKDHMCALRSCPLQKRSKNVKEAMQPAFLNSLPPHLKLHLLYNGNNELAKQQQPFITFYQLMLHSSDQRNDAFPLINSLITFSDHMRVYSLSVQVQ